MYPDEQVFRRSSGQSRAVYRVNCTMTRPLMNRCKLRKFLSVARAVDVDVEQVGVDARNAGFELPVLMKAQPTVTRGNGVQTEIDAVWRKLNAGRRRRQQPQAVHGLVERLMHVPP